MFRLRALRHRAFEKNHARHHNTPSRPVLEISSQQQGISIVDQRFNQFIFSTMSNPTDFYFKDQTCFSECNHLIAIQCSNFSHNLLTRRWFSTGNGYDFDMNAGPTTFVSKYNTSINATASEITRLLQKCGYPTQIGQDIRVTPTHVILKECPFCEKPTQGDPSNLFKLYIKIGGGAFFCHRCGIKGSWYDLRNRIGGHGVEISSPLETIANSKPALSQTSHIPKLPPPRINASYMANLFDVKDSVKSAALKYLTEKRGLTTKTLRKYGVGTAKYQYPTATPTPGKTKNHYMELDSITFPWFISLHQLNEQERLKGNRPYSISELYPTTTLNEELNQNDNPWLLRRIKARSLVNKGFQKLDPVGGGWGFFGWNTIPEKAKEIVVTEGEFDAMAVNQATDMPAISLPSGCRNLPIDLLPLLERFEKIYLWMDNDNAGQQGAVDFAKKIGVKRCFLVRSISTNDGTPIAKDANEALLLGHDLSEYIKQASIVPHEGILTFMDLKEQVIHEICNPHQFTGVKVKSLPKFTKLIKGFRRGELTIITGRTGSGKTTLLGQMSLDMAEQGVNILWGSFEIKNTRLIHKLLQQFSRGPLVSLSSLAAGGKRQQIAREALNSIADRFSALPLYFMSFYGTTDVDKIIDAMEYATYIHDVEHVILDNLQFMLTRDHGNGRRGSYYDKFEIQDIAVERFRKFASDKNVHITLVVHPRKEDEGVPLSMSSVSGTAKATQEADTVLILQHENDKKELQVKKNRFDGTLGSVPLHFHSSSGRFGEEAERVEEGRTLTKIKIKDTRDSRLNSDSDIHRDSLEIDTLI